MPTPACQATPTATTVLPLRGRRVYDRHDKYLNGCQRHFREGHISVHQFTLQK
jgi:cyclopropane-fatty-acyl-phospholipid synthase